MSDWQGCKRKRAIIAPRRPGLASPSRFGQVRWLRSEVVQVGMLRVFFETSDDVGDNMA